jgi:ATP dependent DNA ligase domain
VAYLAHMLQRTFPAGFIAPCLPTKTDKLPSGDLWLHEIKHDGFRIIARKDGDRVRLYSRPGNDMTRRFPLIAEALTGPVDLHFFRHRPQSSSASRFTADASGFFILSQSGERERVTAQVVAVQLDEVEGIQEHVPVMLAIADTAALTQL